MKIGIIGMGLIGGSLAKAFREKVPDAEIIVYDKQPHRLIEKDGYKNTDKLDGFRGCNVVFICTPVDTIADYAQKLGEYIEEGGIITDVGSTKHKIYRKLKNLPYIGGHPMAGSELTGYSASKAHMFENAYYILTPSAFVTEHQIELLKGLIEKTGAITIVIPPDVHDKSVAAISHVPHIIASAMVNSVKLSDDENKSMHTLAAGGFRDITRIASSNPYMWSAVSLENKEYILDFLGVFEQKITDFKTKLINEQTDSIFSFFDEAKNYRDSMDVKPSTGYFRSYQIFVDVLDMPGMIATIAALLSANKINIKNIGIVNNRESENGALQIIFDTDEDMQKSIKLLKEMNFKVHDTGTSVS